MANTPNLKLGSKGPEVRALQFALCLNPDGVFGQNTRNQVVKYQTDRGLTPDGVVGQSTWSALLPILAEQEALPANRDVFFKEIKPLFTTFKQSQVKGLHQLLNVLDDQMINHAAYMLATAYHETAATMQPIEEYGKGKGYKYGKRIKMDGTPYSDSLPIYYGRGYVQLTWYENYLKAGVTLNLDLLKKPEDALNPEVAGRIMILGMSGGWFTGKRLTNYITRTSADYVNARRIINGTDKAAKIAGYAEVFEKALRKAKV